MNTLMTKIFDKIKILSGNQLKIIALIAMTIDHIGYQIFPDIILLRIIGRLSFPIFAFMIAEGCRYTRNRTRHLISVVSLSLICQIVYLVAENSLYMSVLVTFSLAIGWIYAIDNARKQKTLTSWLLAVVTTLAIIFLSVILPPMVAETTDYCIDYGIWGILLPVIIYFAPNSLKVGATAIALIPLCVVNETYYWYSYLAVILLALYSGKRGKANIKNLFYIYYPLHLVVIYILSVLYYM